MKTLAIFTIFVLIFGTSTSFVGDAYAQNDPYILLRIAEQADKQIQNQLDRSYGDSIPTEIQDLYEEGHTTVESLEANLKINDMKQAREDFLTAMKLFQQISRITFVPTTETKITADESDRDIKSELNRLYKYFQNLKSISEKQKTEIELSETERLFTLANDQIGSNNFTGASQTIEEIKILIDSIKHQIRESTSNSASDRIKEFVLKQLEVIQKILDKTDSESPEFDKANSLVTEIEHLIYEDNISDAKKKFGELNRIVNMIKKPIP